MALRTKGPHSIYELYKTGGCATGRELFLLETRDIDFLSIQLRDKNFFSKIIFREMVRKFKGILGIHGHPEE